VLGSPPLLDGGVERGLEVRVTVRQFKAVIEEGGGLVQLPPVVVAVGRLATLLAVRREDLDAASREKTPVLRLHRQIVDTMNGPWLTFAPHMR